MSTETSAASTPPFGRRESLRIEIHTGLEKIRATAVVRSVSSKCGIEFLQMGQEDGEKLRILPVLRWS